MSRRSQRVSTFARRRLDGARAWPTRKGDRTISMCIPCRDEAATIGPLVGCRHGSTSWNGTRSVDELIVLDDRSTDDTAAVAADAGATVVPIDDIHAVHGVGHGKGNALWASLVASTGDFIVWCDGDVTSFTPDWVVRLVAPLLDRPDDVALVKAMYHRPTAAGGGGRTTELVARPLLSLFAPELTGARTTAVAASSPAAVTCSSRSRSSRAGASRSRCCSTSPNGSVRVHRSGRSRRATPPSPLAALALGAGRRGHGVRARSRGCETHRRIRRATRADGSMVPLNLAERPPIAARDAG